MKRHIEQPIIRVADEDRASQYLRSFNKSIPIPYYRNEKPEAPLIGHITGVYIKDGMIIGIVRIDDEEQYQRALVPPGKR